MEIEQITSEPVLTAQEEAERLSSLPDFRVPGAIMEQVINLLGKLPAYVAGSLYDDLTASIRPIEDAPVITVPDAAADTADENQ